MKSRRRCPCLSAPPVATEKTSRYSVTVQLQPCGQLLVPIGLASTRVDRRGSPQRGRAEETRGDRPLSMPSLSAPAAGRMAAAAPSPSTERSSRWPPVVLTDMGSAVVTSSTDGTFTASHLTLTTTASTDATLVPCRLASHLPSGMMLLMMIYFG